jgi:hypothetical protein
VCLGDLAGQRARHVRIALAQEIAVAQVVCTTHEDRQTVVRFLAVATRRRRRRIAPALVVARPPRGATVTSHVGGRAYSDIYATGLRARSWWMADEVFQQSSATVRTCNQQARRVRLLCLWELFAELGGDCPVGCLFASSGVIVLAVRNTRL